MDEYSELIKHLEDCLSTNTKLPDDADTTQKAASAIWQNGYEAAIEQVKAYAATNGKHFCADCGEEIHDHGKWKADSIREGAIKSYGVPLCFTCAMKRKENNK